MGVQLPRLVLCRLPSENHAPSCHVSLWIVVNSVYLIFPWKSCVWTLAPCKRGLYLAGWLWGEDEYKSEAAAVPTPSEVKTASWPLPLATDWEAIPTLLGSATVKGANISGIMRLGTGITEGKKVDMPFELSGSKRVVLPLDLDDPSSE